MTRTTIYVIRALYIHSTSAVQTTTAFPPSGNTILEGIAQTAPYSDTRIARLYAIFTSVVQIKAANSPYGTTMVEERPKQQHVVMRVNHRSLIVRIVPLSFKLPRCLQRRVRPS